MSRKDCDSSVDVEAQKVIIQLALLGGLDVLELLDPGAEVVKLRLLLVELLDVAVVKVGVLGEFAQVLADARLLLADLGDVLLEPGPVGLRPGQPVAELYDLLEGLLDPVTDDARPEEESDLVGLEVRQGDGLLGLLLLADQ